MNRSIRTALAAIVLATIPLVTLPQAALAQDEMDQAHDGQRIARPSDARVTPMPVTFFVGDGSISAMQQAMALGEISSADLVSEYLRQIAAIDDSGPRLNAVMATYPDALDQARAADARRGRRRILHPLHGIPILIKDNIEAAGPLPTTAGSLALADNVTGRDSPLVARLRANGAIILGRTNLSEWANIRSDNSTSGWSATGGLTRNPHDLSRTACGSSSGSGAAIAAGLAAAAIGTETDGSITCPAGVNGIVGFKPTVGLVSRSLIVPISHSQDTAGPMTRSVYDAALIMNAIVGTDPTDPATAEANARRVNYTAGLRHDALRGVRIGVMRDRLGSRADVRALFDEALAVLRAQGAVLVDIADTRSGLEPLGEAEFAVLMHELHADMDIYLAARPGSGGPRSLADLIAFNRAHAGEEMRWFGQETFELAQSKAGLDSEAYRTAAATARRFAGAEGIDRLRRENNVDLLLAITNGPAWTIDLVNGDHFGGPSASQLPAVAGYPHLTVPMGAVEGLPIGLSFIGTRWDDARVLAAGYAYEQASHARVTPRFRAATGP